MKNFFKSLIFIFMPNYWYMNEPYSAAWDAELNRLLDNYDFTFIKTYTAFLDDTELWIVNYPYSCFRPPFTHEFRASRLTIFRAYRKIKPFLLKNEKQDPYLVYKSKIA